MTKKTNLWYCPSCVLYITNEQITKKDHCDNCDCNATHYSFSSDEDHTVREVDEKSIDKLIALLLTERRRKSPEGMNMVT